MIEKFLLEVHYTYVKVNSFPTIGGYHLMVHSKGMVDLFAHTRIQEMDKIRYNLAFREVRQGVENSYGRVGM